MIVPGKLDISGLYELFNLWKTGDAQKRVKVDRKGQIRSMDRCQGWQRLLLEISSHAFNLEGLKVFHTSKLTTPRKASLEAAGWKRWPNPVRPRNWGLTPHLQGFNQDTDSFSTQRVETVCRHGLIQFKRRCSGAGIYIQSTLATIQLLSIIQKALCRRARFPTSMPS